MAKSTTEMSVRDAIEYLRNKVGASQKRLAEAIGLKTPQGFQNIITAKKGMRSDNFVKLVNALGYEVVIRKELTGEEIIIKLDDAGSDEE